MTTHAQARRGLGVSERAGRIAQAEIRSMTIECDRVGGINLAQGVCDLEVPVEVRRGAQAGIDLGFNTYTRYDGLTELRNAIAQKARVFNGIECDPETQVTVSAGSTGSFYCACLALLDPGDEVVLFEPFYGYHMNTVEAVDAVPTYVPLRAPDWAMDADELSAAITSKTRAIVVNTPTNPSGKVFTRPELEAIAKVAERHDLFIFTDEIYEHFIYGEVPHISPATLPGMAERTITISGMSKVFSITGWRIGYSISSPRWAETIGHLNDLVYVCAPAPLQYGVAVGMQNLDPRYYSDLAAEYKVKRDRLCGALADGGLPPSIPHGAYYVLADVSRIQGATGKAKAMNLLSEAGVAGVPGEAFFHDGGHGLIRFNFAKEDDELQEACRRLGGLS
jgi:aminotransferase